MITLKYNANGTEQWLESFDAFSGSDVGVSIATDQSDGVFVSCRSMSANAVVFSTLKYRKNNGNQQWLQYYYPVAFEKNGPVKIVTDANDDVYVTGSAFNGANIDFATIKYLNDGTEKWVELYNGSGSGNDSPSDIAVDDDGNVYVVGQSFNGSSYDFTTIKYGVMEIMIAPDILLEQPTTSHVFYQNEGQLLNTDGDPIPDIKYYTYSASPAIYISDDALSYVFAKRADTLQGDSIGIDTLWRVDMSLHKANLSKPFEMEKVENIMNYYLPHIPEGRKNIKGYNRIVYPNVYDGIDLQYYSNDAGLKYYFIVNPGADKDDINLQFEGASAVSVSSGGGLIIETPFGAVEYDKAHVARINNSGSLVPMPNSGDFESLGGDLFGIDIQNYPSNSMLIIVVDQGHVIKTTESFENLHWSTYFGSTSADLSWAITSDDAGNIAISGETYRDDFPVVNGDPIQILGITDAFISAFTDQHELIFSTFIGGSENETGFDCAMSSLGDIYMVGNTDSEDFPMLNEISAGYFDFTYNGGSDDAFILKFDAINGELLWSTYYGGNSSENLYSIELDDTYIYISGWTDSDVGFPVVNKSGAYNQPSIGSWGKVDMCIAKFDNNLNMTWSTYFGGTEGDAAAEIEIDGKHNLYVRGNSKGANFPVSNPGSNSYNQIHKGEMDATIVCFDQNNALVWSTFIGGSGDDGLQGIKGMTVDENSILTICGNTSSNDFPLEDFGGGAFFQGNYAGEEDAFVVQFDGGHRMIWSTYLGGSDREICRGVASDNSGNVYVVGFTVSQDLILQNMTGVYYQDVLAGNTSFGLGHDVFLYAFNSNKENVWSTYFGGGENNGDGTEMGNDVEIHGSNLYITGATSSKNTSSAPYFPLYDQGTPAYFDGTFNGTTHNDAFISMFDISALNSIEDVSVSSDNGFTVFPNPAKNTISLKFEEDILSNFEVDIIDMNGRVVKSVSYNKVISGNIVSIDLSNLSFGLYNVRLTSDNFVVNKKVAKL